MAGEYTFPKGANVVVAPIYLGWDPNLFPNPLEFRPDRFLESETAGKMTFSYIPFSAGSRNCKLRHLFFSSFLFMTQILRHWTEICYVGNEEFGVKSSQKL